MHKHSNIGFYRITRRIHDLLRDEIGMINATHFAIVFNTDVNRTTVRIGKGNNLFLYAVCINGF